jgi:hypothetical protein
VRGAALQPRADHADGVVEQTAKHGLEGVQDKTFVNIPDDKHNRRSEALFCQ